MPLPSVDELLQEADAELFEKYSVIKKQLQDKVQTRWCARWAEGNDHGPRHIERVLEYLAEILGPDPIRAGRLNAFELFLAATAVVAHDLGVMHGREDHAKRSAQIVKIVAATNTLLFGPPAVRVLGPAIVCHSSHVDIDVGCQGLPPVVGKIGRYDVRPRFIAALVRLADELDEDYRRAEKWVQDLAEIPEASRPYWEFCQRIQGIRLDGSNIVFDVVFEPEDAGRWVLAGETPELFIRFFANKIAKINRERAKVRAHLGDLARQYLLVFVGTTEGAPGWTIRRGFVFSDDTCLPKEAERDAVNRFVHAFPGPDREPPPSAPPAPKGAPPAPKGGFVVGPPIEDPRSFFGRGAAVKGIFRLWKGQTLQNAAVIGPPRSGKTSLLLHMLHLATSPPGALRADQEGQRPPEVRGHRFAFVNFQDPRLGDPEGLLRHILTQLGIPVPKPCTMSSFYTAVEEGLSTPAVILLDELGVALTRYPALDDDFWDSLRSLPLAVRGKLGFVLSTHELPQSIAQDTGRTSTFFGVFGFTTMLGPLTDDEARQLVASAPLPFADEDVDWIVAASGRWPILLQALSSARLAALEDGERGEGWREEGLRQMAPFRFLLETR